MTLEELDNALSKLGLDVNSESGKNSKNRVITRYGRYILESKKDMCLRCWFRENNKCSNDCFMYTISDNPYDAGVAYLTNKNNVDLFSFIIMFVIPQYEEDTGQSGTLDRLSDSFRRKYRKEFGSKNSVNLL